MIQIQGARMLVKSPMVIATAAALRDTGEQAILSGIQFVDLANVTEADSSAVAVLLAWTRVAKERRQPLTILDVPPSVHSLAALYGVTELLPLT